MKQSRWLAAVVLFLACGGPREPGAVANDVVYWKVESSNIDFAQCSDDPQFRDQIQPIAFQADSYFVYKVSKDAKQATVQSCQNFDPSSCKDSSPALTFDVVGNELSLNREFKEEVGDAGCNLQTIQSWVGEDKGTSLALNVSNTMSLTDAPAACDRIEQSAKQYAPNGLGYQGCVVTYKLGFSHP